MRFFIYFFMGMLSVFNLTAISADRHFTGSVLPQSDFVSYANFKGMQSFGIASYFNNLLDLKLKDKYCESPDEYEKTKTAFGKYTLLRGCVLADLSEDFSKNLNVWAFFRNFSSTLCVAEFRTAEEAVRIQKILSEIVLNRHVSHFTDGPVLVSGHGRLMRLYRENLKKASASARPPVFAGTDSFFSWTLSPLIQKKISQRIASKFAGTPLQDALSGFSGFQFKGKNDGVMDIAFESNFQNQEQAFQFKVNIMEGFFLGIMKMYLMQVAQKQMELFKTMKVRQLGPKAVFSCVVRPDEVDLIAKAIAMVWENYRQQ